MHGATRTILYGEDANLNGVLDPNEDDGTRSLPEDNADGKLDPGILEYVTVFSRESNKRSDGTDRINISRFNDQVRQLLTDTFGDQRAQELAAPFPPNSPITSPLDFYIRSSMTQQEFSQISDAITTRTGDYASGLVNINTASEQVLACIPGIGADKAGTVVAARLSRGQADTDITWLVDAIGQEGALQAGRYITGRSWQCSADVAAVGRHGRGYRRVRVVIDSSSGTPKIVYRRDLSSLGWALGSEVRQQAVWKEPR